MNAPAAIVPESAVLPFDPLLEDEEYQAFKRALDRIEGFGLFFVECSPIQAERLIERIGEELPGQTCSHLLLAGPVDSLFERVASLVAAERPDILFVEGLERSLVEYIKPGFGGRGDYYKEDSVPRVLGHLNLQRERFRDTFTAVRFVFLVPRFALRYFILRGPDFFDWRSGIFRFATDVDALQQGSRQILEQYHGIADYEEFVRLSPAQRNERLLQLQALIEEPQQSAQYRSILYAQHGSLLNFSGQFEEAIASFSRQLDLDPNDASAWVMRAASLLNLGRYDDVLSDLEQAARLAPKASAIPWLRAQALLAVKRKDDALSAIEEAVALAPEDAFFHAERGIILKSLGRFDKALASLNKATKLNPRKSAYWGIRGDILTSCRRFEQAARSYDKAIELSPDQPRGHLLKGLSLLNLERYTEAVASFQEAARMGLNSANLWYLLGLARMRTSDYPQALESLDKVIQLEPTRWDAWRARSDVLGELGRWDESTASFENFAQSQTDPEHAWLERGQWLFSRSPLKSGTKPIASTEIQVWPGGAADRAMTRAALDSLNRALAILPNDLEALFTRAGTSLNLRRFEESFQDADRVVAMQPDRQAAWFMRGVALVGLKRTDEAIASFDEASRLGKGDWYLRQVRGIVLFQEMRYQEALRSFSEALAIRPENVQIHLDQAATLGNLGRYAEAKLHCRKAIKSEPTNYRAWEMLGQVQLGEGDMDKGLESLGKAIRFNCDKYGGWLGRGKLLKSFNLLSEALTSYDHAIGLRSDDPAAWMGRAQVLYTMERYVDALESLDSAVALDVQDSEAWGLRGLVLARLDRPDDALSSCATGIEKSPGNAVPHLMKARCCAVLDRAGAAVDALRQAIALDAGVAGRLGGTPEFAGIADDPAFRALLPTGSEAEEGPDRSTVRVQPRPLFDPERHRAGLASFSVLASSTAKERKPSARASLRR